MISFIENVKEFMKENGIKTSFLISRTNVSESKIYNIFGKNTRGKLQYNEMQEIAMAFGKSISYFEKEEFVSDKFSATSNVQVSFFAGNLSEDDKIFLRKIKNLALRYDAIVR